MARIVRQCFHAQVGAASSAEAGGARRLQRPSTGTRGADCAHLEGTRHRHHLNTGGTIMSEGRNSQFIGVAGVHYVASYLAHLGLHAVPTTRNVAGPDVLVSTVNGASSLSLQVKTAAWALRTRGRGKNKRPHHYEWDIGWRSARMNLQKLFVPLVDLKEFEEMPDVFVVPSAIIYDYFDGGDP